MPEIAKPERATYFIARNASGSIVHYGITQPNQVTTTGQGVLEFSADEPEFLGIAQPYADKFPDLPSEGELTAGDMYNFGSTVVIVRQAHNRTEFDPSETPALFMTANATQDWILNESVSVGTRRLHEGQWYEAIQAHVTEFEPQLVPALWKAITIGPDDPEWTPLQTWAVDDVVTFEGNSYRCRQTHTNSNPAFTPPVVPALWELI